MEDVEDSTSQDETDSQDEDLSGDEGAPQNEQAQTAEDAKKKKTASHNNRPQYDERSSWERGPGPREYTSIPPQQQQLLKQERDSMLPAPAGRTTTSGSIPVPDLLRIARHHSRGRQPADPSNAARNGQEPHSSDVEDVENLFGTARSPEEILPWSQTPPRAQARESSVHDASSEADDEESVSSGARRKGVMTWEEEEEEFRRICRPDPESDDSEDEPATQGGSESIQPLEGDGSAHSASFQQDGRSASESPSGDENVASMTMADVFADSDGSDNEHRKITADSEYHDEGPAHPSWVHATQTANRNNMIENEPRHANQAAALNSTTTTSDSHVTSAENAATELGIAGPAPHQHDPAFSNGGSGGDDEPAMEIEAPTRLTKKPVNQKPQGKPVVQIDRTPFNPVKTGEKHAIHTNDDIVIPASMEPTAGPSQHEHATLAQNPPESRNKSTSPANSARTTSPKRKHADTDAPAREGKRLRVASSTAASRLRSPEPDMPDPAIASAQARQEFMREQALKRAQAAAASSTAVPASAPVAAQSATTSTETLVAPVAAPATLAAPANPASLYERFREAYPAYDAPEEHFVSQCNALRADAAHQLSPAQWDDFVALHYLRYADYVRECLRTGKSPGEYGVWYARTAGSETECRKRVVTPANLGVEGLEREEEETREEEEEEEEEETGKRRPEKGVEKGKGSLGAGGQRAAPPASSGGTGTTDSTPPRTPGRTLPWKQPPRPPPPSSSTPSSTPRTSMKDFFKQFAKKKKE